MAQVQGHGFYWENEVITLVFGREPRRNNTETHDLSHTENTLNPNEDVSIKTTGGSAICCSDIFRFLSYDHNMVNTIIVINYEQVGVFKIIKRIYEINYSAECRAALVGDNFDMEALRRYVEDVRNIPPNLGNPREHFDYVANKPIFSGCLTINPKVDHGTQRRVQCSIPNFLENLAPFITYVSPVDTPNLIRGVEISREIESPPRRN